MSPSLPPVRRVAAIVAAVTVALPALVFSIRTGSAGWLVEPTPYLAPVPTTEDLQALRTAASLAPGEARYPFFEATLLQRSMRSHWLDREAPGIGRSAAASVTGAISLVGANPYFHRLAGSIALERARLPHTPATERATLVAAGVQSLVAALELNPESPLLQQLVGAELVGAWEVVGPTGRELAQDSLAKAAVTSPQYLRASLAAVWISIPPNDRLVAVRRIIPHTASASQEVARFVEERLSRDNLDDDTRRLLRDFALDEYLAAATLEGPELSRFQTWIDAHARLDPGREADLVARIEELVEEYEEAPEVWVALSRALTMAGEDDGAMAAANRAVELAEGSSGEVRAAALRQRAGLFATDADPQRSVEDLQAAAQALPRAASIRLELARALETAGRDDEALATYEVAVRVEPGSSGARSELARAYARRFQYLDAIEQWRNVLVRNQSAVGPTLEIARLYRAINVRDRAIDFYSRVLDIDPEHAAARRELDALLQGRR